jgi:hypothetical protein
VHARFGGRRRNILLGGVPRLPYRDQGARFTRARSFSRSEKDAPGDPSKIDYVICIVGLFDHAEAKTARNTTN